MKAGNDRPALPPSGGSGEKPLPSPAPSRFRDRELWVGVFAILGIVAILTALFTLTDASLFRGRRVIHTVVQDAAGIRRGDPVQMHGVNIGRVSRFAMTQQGVEISLELERGYTIPADSRVELRSGSLLGGMVANIVPGTSSESASGGALLPGTVAKGMFDQIDSLQQQAGQTLSRFQRLLDENTIDDLHSSGAHLRDIMQQIDSATAEQRVQLAALSASLRHTAEALEQTATGPEIGRSVRRIDTVTARLDSVSSSLALAAGSARSILERIDRGEGSLGKLTRDDALYNNAAEAAATMKKTADEFARLAADIRANPKRYLRVSVF